MISANEIYDGLIHMLNSKFKKYNPDLVAKVAVMGYILMNKKTNQDWVVISDDVWARVGEYSFYDIGFKKCVDIGRIYFNTPVFQQKNPCVYATDATLTELDDRHRKYFEELNVEMDKSKRYPDVTQQLKDCCPISPVELDAVFKELSENGANIPISKVDKKDYVMSDLYSIVVPNGDFGLRSVKLGGSAINKEICELMGFSTDIINFDSRFMLDEGTVNRTEALHQLFSMGV